MAECYRYTQDISHSIDYFKKALINHDRCENCMDNLISILFRTRRLLELVEIITNVNTPIYGIDYTRLTEYMFVGRTPGISLLRRIAHSFMELNKFKSLTDAIEDAAIISRKRLRMIEVTRIASFLAKTYYEFGNDRNRAVRIWKHIIKPVGSSNSHDEVCYARKDALFCLSRHYLLRSIETSHDSSLSKEYSQELERLAMTKFLDIFIQSFEPSLLLGVWLNYGGHAEEAYKCFQMQIAEALHLLSPKGLDTRINAQVNLAGLLLAAGDDRNAIALAQAIRKSGISGRDDFWFLSDGCDVDMPTYNVSFCRYCTNLTGLCVPCMELLKANNLRVKVCSPRHDWVVTPPLERNIQGKLFVDGEYVDFEDWKRQLKEKWGL